MCPRTWDAAVLLGLLLPALSWAEGNKPLSEIVKSVEEQGYMPGGVELKNGVWEIQAAKGGKNVELKVDAKSGETLTTHEEKETDDEDPEEEASQGATETLQTPLTQLQWLVGDWIDEGADATIKTRCRWAHRNHFLSQTFTVETKDGVVLEGAQVIAWDPVRQQIRSWTFDSEGGFGEGAWSQDGNHWNVKTAHSLFTGGRASSINVFTPVDENSIRWKSINREIEGEIQPNIPEVTVVRRSHD